MLFIFFGPSCSGKSTAAKVLADRIGAEIWTGRDYLRLAKGEAEARKEFARILRESTEHGLEGGRNVVHVLTDPPESVGDLPEAGRQLRVHFTADLETLVERFAPRTGGKVPPGVVRMLERSREVLAACRSDMTVDTAGSEGGDVAGTILSMAAEV